MKTDGKMRFAIIGLMIACVSCITSRPVNKYAQEQQLACVENIAKNDYSRAKTNCQLCLDFDNTVPECYNGLGLVAYANGLDDKAVKYFHKALSYSRYFAQAKNNMGAIYFKQGNFRSAITYFQSVAKMDPGYEDGRYNLALTYLRMGEVDLTEGQKDNAKENFKKAEQQYKKLLAMHPMNSNGYRDMGLIWTYRAQLSKLKSESSDALAQASNFFQQCLQVNPEDSSCYNSYGHSLLLRHQYNEALYQFVQCLAYEPDSSQCSSGMTKAYEGSNLKSKALKNYIAEIKKDPGNAEGRYGYCTALFDSGMSEMAASECETAVNLDPKLCSAYYSLGMYYKKILNADKASSNCRSYILCDARKSDQSKREDCQNVITASK